MVTTGAILHGDRDRILAFNEIEHPVALQLGGSHPGELAQCAQVGQDFGYDEINLNVGCPSDRVQTGRFGACLMLEPDLVAECVAAMVEAVNLPVTVKTRIGVDHQDSYDDLLAFVDKSAQAGCQTFIIHARKAWLKGLSPKQNREVPPLQYERVFRLKRDFPDLDIIINGGIADLNQAEALLQQVDGVMLGREAYYNPYLLAEVDRRFYGTDTPTPGRVEVIERLIPFIESELAKGNRLNSVVRHILGLFHGEPGARAWRRHLSENAAKPGAGLAVVDDALALLAQNAAQMLASAESDNDEKAC
jgi:tRNA-dihydrouridine synthase A